MKKMQRPVPDRQAVMHQCQSLVLGVAGLLDAHAQDPKFAPDPDGAKDSQHARYHPHYLALAYYCTRMRHDKSSEQQVPLAQLAGDSDSVSFSHMMEDMELQSSR